MHLDSNVRICQRSKLASSLAAVTALASQHLQKPAVQIKVHVLIEPIIQLHRNQPASTRYHTAARHLAAMNSCPEVTKRYIVHEHRHRPEVEL